ncbi:MULTISPECIES: IgA Peptidase M64 [unclassified Duganella]|uniref:IgA Peptidase M64 n=1 Tax=unclassified Duganella TaxID=2636909 RepID=UPI00087EB4CC|nr:MULTISPECIES: IgA Peptidase M64 [unclassified Duganella]SDG25770.1 Peptidase M64 N-terminus [Duganella sp. OV458]SDJ22247.1 IgA peptidase. Metallo peptidase. MEROPS family M64 [Duganella sp. OV510]
MLRRLISLLALFACIVPALAAQPATMRLDYLHSGNALDEHYAIERVVIEPLPWPGNLTQTIDQTNRGNNLVEVVDAKTGKLLYSRGFSTIFAEWRTTDEATRANRGFQESVRFPRPEQPVKVRILKRDERNLFSVVWTASVDPNAMEVIRKQPPAPVKPLGIRVNGPSEDKVDLLIVGDGYTQADMKKFEADARRLADHLFTTSPFKERASDFNVWAIARPTSESGVSRPSTGAYKESPLGTRYDIFGSERYVLTTDNRALRELAQYAPYEFIEILVNNDTYGGGGIFGQFSTAAAGNDWANYLFVHEFGHHFAGLADEYYTSPVAYATGGERREPWEPNATALHDPANLKWNRFVKQGTPLPTPWPKDAYETASRAYQKERAALRANNRPEAEMSALFTRDLQQSSALFSRDPHVHTVGAFEGANYEATGYYRPEMQCIMFDRSEKFCSVCAEAITTIIDLYSRPARQ